MNNTAGSAEFAVANWFRSSYSAANNECVEVTHTRSGVGIRDSKAPARRALAVSPTAFAAFVGGVKA